jgi:hypothetical protein
MTIYLTSKEYDDVSTNDPAWLELTRATAFAEATRIKTLRRDLKAGMRQVGPSEGRYILADAIETMPDWLESADVWKILEWAPQGQGCPPFVDRICAAAGVRSMRRLRQLSPRQRVLVAGLLRDVGVPEQVAA